MFRTLIYPSSGPCDCVAELPHRSSCSQFVVCGSICCGWYLVVFDLQASACKWKPPKTARNKSSHTQRTENKTTNVVIHQHSRRLLKLDILMSETCWAHNKWNKIASDIKLVFHSSTRVHDVYVYFNPCRFLTHFALYIKTSSPNSCNISKEVLFRMYCYTCLRTNCLCAAIYNGRNIVIFHWLK